MDPISAIMSLATTVLNKLWGSKDQELQQQFLLQFQQAVANSQLLEKQIDVNVEEAKSSNLFVAGWRPAVGWVCVMSFSWQFFFEPMITYLCVISGHPIPPLPVFDFTYLSTILMGMLGLGGMRTYEKVKGVTR